LEALEAYARDADAEHLPAWSRYDDGIGSSGAVGIWHEPDEIDPGSYETVDNDMPPHGLGEAAALVPATGRRESAAGRIGNGSADLPESITDAEDDNQSNISIY
jgi:hypothetical protein